MKKRIEFSKMIFFFVTFFIIALTIFCFVMIFKTNDLSPLAYLIPAWFSELGITTGFYYSKAKAENLIKLRKLYKLDNETIQTIKE
ncbi:hypothetical protein HMPREF9630_00200 [Peptoanaerobacter stomatis]|uniref:Uncharacterized protein n=1 Tax=Peptoanaerobacter stomatis TaxID=796937 RepID=V9HRP9_9FIRM|nr:hypothetical protein [Peptoanaerobacter stomatis]EHL18475.1 hypothetical protein HMPREF9630_00200 [Peptoanaerobacter stomatis]